MGAHYTDYSQNTRDRISTASRECRKAWKGSSAYTENIYREGSFIRRTLESYSKFIYSHSPESLTIDNPANRGCVHKEGRCFWYLIVINVYERKVHLLSIIPLNYTSFLTFNSDNAGEVRVLDDFFNPLRLIQLISMKESTSRSLFFIFVYFARHNNRNFLMLKICKDPNN